MSNKNINTIIEEMRQAAEATIRAAGEGKRINLANLTCLLDSWRFSLEHIEKMKDKTEL